MFEKVNCDLENIVCSTTLDLKHWLPFKSIAHIVTLQYVWRQIKYRVYIHTKGPIKYVFWLFTEISCVQKFSSKEWYWNALCVNGFNRWLGPSIEVVGKYILLLIMLLLLRSRCTSRFLNKMDIFRAAHAKKPTPTQAYCVVTPETRYRKEKQDRRW